MLHVLLLSAVASAGMIPNVPYHRQITDYACGDASVEMVLHHWSSPDVDQRAIIDVMRTTNENGTLSYDLVRAGHFSWASGSVIPGLFPSQAPSHGWSPYRKLGMGAFSRRGDACWLQDLFSVLDAGIPVVVLQYYGPGPTKENGTHFRVAVGYDALAGTVSLLDPWDRSNVNEDDDVIDVQPKLYTISNSEMCSLWSYAEANGEVQYGGYFGAALVPWTVTLTYQESSSNALAITANITYTCPGVMGCGDAPTALQSVAELTLPPSLKPLNATSVALPDMTPGASVSVTWYALEIDGLFPAPNQPPSTIDVIAMGTITASVPEVAYVFPPYNYTDIIGGQASVGY